MSTELRLYALMRGDLGHDTGDVPIGKLCAQAGHAFIGALYAARTINPEILAQYEADPLQGKIVLKASGVEDLTRIKKVCEEKGIPCALITDAGLTVFKHPTVTVLGIGPITKKDAGKVVKLSSFPLFA